MLLLTSTIALRNRTRESCNYKSQNITERFHGDEADPKGLITFLNYKDLTSNSSDEIELESIIVVLRRLKSLRKTQLDAMRNKTKSIVGALCFVIALISYTMCVQPTVPFWDCGEFSAAAAEQQVPHPPGAPLFLMVGKIFHMIPIGDPAVRINMVSVVASAATVSLLYFIIVMTITWWRKQQGESEAESMIVYAASAIGALAFCFSDTLWFNAVESEVYASSSLFVAIIVYLMLRWNEVATEPGNERYLVLIAYLIGLSTGVHLLSVLTIYSLGLIIYFRRYQSDWKSFIIMGALTLIGFAIVYPGVVKYFPALLSGNLPFKNEAQEYYVEDEFWVKLFGVLMVLTTLAGVVYGIRTKRSVLAMICVSFSVMFLGYTVYTQTLLRANANPPMNEDAPRDFHGLISYLGREQYGDAPMFPRRFERDPDKVEAYKKYGPYTPPPVKHIESIRTPGMSFSVPDYGKMKSNSGDWKFLFSYQLDHMFLRYLLWNFFGRTSDVQDAEAWSFTTSSKYLDELNYNNGYAAHFPIVFFGIPFLLGLLGMIVHLRRDPKMAAVFVAMFLVMGVVAAFAQNQQEPQPRERDYFYTGAYMVWALWIGVGVYFLAELSLKKFNKQWMQYAILCVALVVVPFNMARAGWFIHSRAGNYLPFDYSYNILQSCDQDAILFTNGDNDTFPLWLLQDVYGVRRDVRIVNLSLAQTLSYVYDLKNLSPWGAKKIPLSFSDESLTKGPYEAGALSMKIGPAQSLRIPLSPELQQRFKAPAGVDTSAMQWVFTGYNRGNNQFTYTIPMQIVGDIVKQTQMERPICFSVTCGYPTSELYCGLGNYCRQEGMVYRVCPYPQGEAGEVINEEAMEQNLLHLKPDWEYTREAQRGFKMRNLNNPNVYYDQFHRQYVDNYRTLYVRTANILINQGRYEKGVAYLDAMAQAISSQQFVLSYPLLQDLADLYDKAGAHKQAVEMATACVQQCKDVLDRPYLASKFAQFQDRMPPALVASQSYEVLRDYESAKKMLQLLADEQEQKGNLSAAATILETYVSQMKGFNDPNFEAAIRAFSQRAQELRKRTGAVADSTK